MEKNVRPSWDDYFMQILETVKTRSTCLRRQVGALIVKDKRIVATGYNGAPSGLLHCYDVGCIREKLKIPSGEKHELCRAIHAEQNAIIQAAAHGARIQGAVMYITCSPCVLCAKMIINAGIEKIVFSGEYPDKMAIDMLNEAGVEMVRYEQVNT